MKIDKYFFFKLGIHYFAESCSTPTTSITNDEEMNNDIDETVAPVTTLVDQNHNKDNENTKCKLAIIY